MYDGWTKVCPQDGPTCGGPHREQHPSLGDHRPPGEVGAAVAAVAERHGAPVTRLGGGVGGGAQLQVGGPELQRRGNHVGPDQNLARVMPVHRVRDHPGGQGQPTILAYMSTVTK